MLQIELAKSSPLSREELDAALDEIREDAERAAKLTSQLLLFGRRQVMQSRQVELNEMMRQLARMLRRVIGEQIELSVRESPSPLVLQADSTMIDQVLLNLAINSRDAMPNGGRLDISTSDVVLDDEEAARNPNARVGHFAVLSVSDTGSGMSPSVLEHIFEPFFTTKEPGKGTRAGPGHGARNCPTARRLDRGEQCAGRGNDVSGVFSAPRADRCRARGNKAGPSRRRV